VAAGKIDAAISYEPELLLARNKGLPLVSVAALVQEPLTSIVSLGSKHITTPAKLRGKIVGDAGIPYQHAYLTTILSHAGVPAKSVKEINVGADLLPAMLSGKVDATLGAYWNVEAIQLQRSGHHPVALRMDQLGVPTYAELVVVVRKRFLDQTGASEVRRFLQATARGYARLSKRPQEGVDALVRASHGLDPALQLASVKATLPVFFPAGHGKPWGWQDRAAWDRYALWMKQHGLIHGVANGGAAVTTEFLPGQQLDPKLEGG
jgi:putative hydroxymethylpyrimidine transport system substrate-binding protein